jgi:probable addiction module antidote protein
MAVKTRTYDTANYLSDEETIAAYLEEVIEFGDAALVAEALGTIARARGMAQIARDSGLSRENLYRTLSPTGNPELGTFLKVLQAMKLRIAIEPDGGTDTKDVA